MTPVMSFASTPPKMAWSTFNSALRTASAGLRTAFPTEADPFNDFAYDGTSPIMGSSPGLLAGCRERQTRGPGKNHRSPPPNGPPPPFLKAKKGPGPGQIPRGGGPS